MTTTQQPDALRLVDKYEIEGFLQDHRFAQNEWCRQAAAELRRLHAENQDLQTRVQELGEMARENRSKRVIELEQRIAEMEEQMAAIGAGGVEPLRKRAEAHDLAARQRELQLLGEIEALERLALNVLKQLGVEATPIAWHVTGCSTMLSEHDAKAEAKRCGGSAKAVPLYTAPPTKDGLDAQTIKHISALSELVRTPNAEYFADAHNAAVHHLRAIAAQAKNGGAA